MNMSVFLKMVKDGLRGGMVAFMPLIISGMTGAQTIAEVVGGLISAVLGIVAGAVRGSSTTTSDVLKVINDVLYGVLVAAQPIIQHGVGQGMSITYIFAGIGIASLGVLSNVLHDDYSTATGILKIVKDCIISLINALVPVLQAGMTAGTSLVVILVAFGHQALSICANTVEADIFGVTGQSPTVTPTTPAAPGQK